MIEALCKIDLIKSKLLVVDDSPPSLEILQQILRGLRVRETQVCRSAGEASEHLARKRFDLILADIEMPEEDGVSLTRSIRRNSNASNFTTPIILLSGAPSMEVLVSARDAGANVVIKKPVTPGVLLSRITWLARSPREFVHTENYRGPDRRFKRGGPPEGMSERRACALMETADRVLDQSEIDNFFS